MKRATAVIVEEYGPFPGVERVHGVTYDGRHVWFASDGKLHALDPVARMPVRTFEVAASAGTTFDGRHLYQIADDRIQKVDPESGRVIATIPAPGGAGCSGLSWGEGSLWVGRYLERTIYQIDPGTGAVVRTLESNRFVTGVTWTEGELWHGTSEEDRSDVRRVDPATGAVLEMIEMPPGLTVSGLEADGADHFFCGGGASGKVRRIRRRESGPGPAGRAAKAGR